MTCEPACSSACAIKQASAFLKAALFPSGGLFLPFYQLSGHGTGAAGAIPALGGWGVQQASERPLHFQVSHATHPDRVSVLAEKGSS